MNFSVKVSLVNFINKSLRENFIFRSVSISSPRHVQVKYQDSLANMSDFNQNIETSCNSNLKLTQLKDMHIYCTQKLVKE